MIVASGIAMQYGAKPLFPDVSVKFGGGKLRVLLAQALVGDPDCLLGS